MGSHGSRRPLQFSLLTAVVMMLTAGVLLGLNCTEQTFFPYQFGWPHICLRKENWVFANSYWTWNVRLLLTNLMYALAILLVAAVVCERTIRRNWAWRCSLEETSPAAGFACWGAVVYAVLAGPWLREEFRDERLYWVAGFCIGATIMAFGIIVHFTLVRLFPRLSSSSPPPTSGACSDPAPPRPQ
jgi:hypothetical protein